MKYHISLPYLINHHNFHFVQLHCLLLQDLEETPWCSYDNLKEIHRLKKRLCTNVEDIKECFD